MLLAVGSVKGSPGVTTSLAALAAGWPADRALLLVEADPSGGDLGVRFDLVDEPSLVTLAAAGRFDLDEGGLRFHCQSLPVDPGVAPRDRLALLAPVGPERSIAALTALRTRLVSVLGKIRSHDVLVDCGRLDPGSLALDLLPGADAVFIVCRPTVGDVHHIRARAPGLGRRVELLVIGDRPYAPPEVATVLDLPIAATLPDDARGALSLAGGAIDGHRVLRRSLLLRSARDVAADLVRRFGQLQIAVPDHELGAV